MFKERKESLINAYKEDKEVLDMIQDTLDSYAAYIEAVNNMENSISIAKYTLDPEDYRKRIEVLDRNRRIIHNGIIAGTKFLNTLSKAVGLDCFFEGDTSNRMEISEFAMQIVKETFENRIK